MKATVKITKSVAATATLDGAIHATVNAHATSALANLQESKEVSLSPAEETFSAVVLPDEGFDAMKGINVTVAAIPQNYGRITYNGTTITVY